jgi:hypothetical protein
MKFGDRQPGTSTTFIDAGSAESILQIASDVDGRHLVAYRLYDSGGALVAEREDLEHYPDGVSIHSSGGELLLSIPKNADENIQYRLYGHDGELLTSSNGVRTMIYQRLRTEGGGRNWVAHPKA